MHRRPRRIHELRQEGEEDRGLRVQEVDHEAVAEDASQPLGRGAGVGIRLAGHERADADPDQIGRAQIFHHREGERRGDDQRRQPDRRRGDMHDRAEMDAEHRCQARRAALLHRARDDVEHGRPEGQQHHRGNDEHPPQGRIGHGGSPFRAGLGREAISPTPRQGPSRAARASHAAPAARASHAAAGCRPAA